MLTLHICSTTTDLNIHEIQMVADHLSVAECRQLSEALHMTGYRLDHPVTGNNEPHIPCLDLLLLWDMGEGRDETFNILALRLQEIGRHDLANMLSRTVYHEKSEAVRNALRLDLFRNLIGQDSPLLEESPAGDDPDARRPPDAQDSLTWIQTVSLAFGIPSLLIVCILLYAMSPWKPVCLRKRLERIKKKVCYIMCDKSPYDKDREILI